MKKNAIGNGSTQCILCGDEFGLLGASPTYCDDCKKVGSGLVKSVFGVGMAVIQPFLWKLLVSTMCICTEIEFFSNLA